jgi:PAS domain-containing protein
MTGTCMDVTSRKQAEEALRRRESEFKALVENDPDLTRALIGTSDTST